ncbi:MAG TPA: ABC transporter ATP-binding protein [Acidimicrobiia bacterium]|nr:ABC transporter ATP-binding protein [Acidimicrobiia bacterium]
MSAVSVHALTKSYGPLKAVNGIDLEIAVGEVVAILGPNGAGKTTTVEMIEGFRRPDSGTISVLGHDPSDRPAELLDRIGIVLQEGGIEEDLTVREAIEAQRRPYAEPMSADEAIETVDLVEKADERIKGLSGGQRRRLDLALGIVGNPDLLFLDEPTTGFDPAARRRSWEAIRQLASSGTTVVLTTHYLEEAQQLADRVVVMSMGEIVANGSPDDLGERRSGLSTIRFRIDPSRAGALGVEPDAGGWVVTETHDPIRLINELTGKALATGIAIEDFEVGKITLEEAYLRLVTHDG